MRRCNQHISITAPSAESILQASHAAFSEAQARRLRDAEDLPTLRLAPNDLNGVNQLNSEYSFGRHCAPGETVERARIITRATLASRSASRGDDDMAGGEDAYPMWRRSGSVGAGDVFEVELSDA